MTKFAKIIAPALVATLGLGTLATPAVAHSGPSNLYGNRVEAARYTPVRNFDVRRDIKQLDRQIARAHSRRAISTREARGLQREADQVKRLYAQYARNGLTARETRAIQNRIDRIQYALRAERRDRDGRRG
ncbi:hypothetical protein [Novosphingobium aquimarinum]|uniref:hypothetical protein n=1 Tax=Novosphingobium aquimarinum TaxID=2682494 RepID=UPI0012EBB740|nr:hypothetical protein [Novosphingobium aquimarinum]